MIFMKVVPKQINLETIYGEEWTRLNKDDQAS